MSVNLTVVMAVVVVLALGAAAFARGRWSGPWWLLLIGAVVVHPLRIPLDRAEGVPDGWLRWAFQAACGLLVAIVLAPVYHRLRRPGAEDGQGSGEGGTRPADAPNSPS
ncbi:hypothetical protein J7I94_23150 [Streptomyces sp. ISL-12]|uniref:hypothetical protein n=1 Tax=Streptomyces sp. ISL-12 TaxID=2819177 RepID=UPI001BE53384|nr:hypothetical protein [Streptomyces sp. ISL-12]MBT2413427.1 hypothetical protein [Streptomyces sp. ISL-12]